MMSHPQPDPTPLRIAGAPNFRDLGGLPTTDGRRTRHGVLYRSSGLEELTPDDIDVLTDRVQLRTVVDLRSPAEVDVDGPAPLAEPAVAYRNLPLQKSSAVLTHERPLDATGRTDVARVYYEYLEASAGSVVTLFDILADPAGTPAVVHCAAGKDRTGVVVALVLRAVGVTLEAVAEDYQASGANLDGIVAYLLRRPSHADLLARLPPGSMDADPRDLMRFLVRMDTEHGGVDRWLRAAGVDQDVLDVVAARLVGPSDEDPRA